MKNNYILIQKQHLIRPQIVVYPNNNAVICTQMKYDIDCFMLDNNMNEFHWWHRITQVGNKYEFILSYSKCLNINYSLLWYSNSGLTCDEVRFVKCYDSENSISPTNNPSLIPTKIPTKNPTTTHSPTYLPSLSPINNKFIINNGDICPNGYEIYEFNDKYCIKCEINEIGIGGICKECNNGEYSLNNKCVVCPENYIGQNGKCNIYCKHGTNELHTECEVAWYGSVAFQAIVSVLSVTGLGFVGSLCYCCRKHKKLKKNVEETNKSQSLITEQNKMSVFCC